MLKLIKHLFIFLLFCVTKLVSQTTFYPLCNNTDFESSPVGSYTSANAVTGWSVSSSTVSCTAFSNAVWSPGSSEFSIVATPFTGFPVIGTVLNSPLGGTKVARLNNMTPNSYRTRLATTLTITTSNTLFQYAYAGYYENPGHGCCDQPGLTLRVLNSLGQSDNCKSTILAAGCPMVSSTYCVSMNGAWTDWQVKYIDFSSYVGSSVTIEFITQDCTFGGHIGTTLIDAGCTTQFVTNDGWPSVPCAASPVYYCVNSNTACINGPMGYASYTWSVPPFTSYTLSNGFLSSGILISNPVPNSIYTVSANYPNGCINTFTYAMVPGGINLCNIQSSPSCPGGAAGSATVYATGSATGYNYLWTNSSNSVVGTGPVVSNLPPGIYNISVTAAGNNPCGVTSGTVQVQTSTLSPVSQVPKPFCGNTAYFNIASGSNFQWYVNNTAVTGSLASLPSFTQTNATNGGIVQVGYNNFGCRDSLVYTTFTISPGYVSALQTNTICTGANNGSAVFSFTPSGFSTNMPFSFTVNSANSTASYSSVSTASNSTTYSVSNLLANGNYSVRVFDGACYATNTLNILPYIFDYTLSANSVSLCSGSQTAILCNFSTNSLIAQHTYSWSPTLYLASNVFNAPFAIIVPTISAGSSTLITYSLSVTPTIVNCPLTKTVSVNIFNPLMANLAPVNQVLCRDWPNTPLTYTASNPTFITQGVQPAISAGGVITHSLTNYGINTFTLVSSLGSCSYSTSGTFTVNGPVLNVSGANSICSGDQTTLSCTGANSYTWSNGSNNSWTTVSPLVSTIYAVSGTNVGDNCVSSKSLAIDALALPTLAVSGFSSIVCQGDEITLSVSGANSYTWNTGSTGSTVTFTAGNNGPTNVIGTNTNGCTDSMALTFSVDACTALTKHLTLSTQLSAYPNPTSGIINVKLEMINRNGADLQIVNSLGQVVYSAKLNAGQQQLNLEHLVKGLYVMLVDSSENMWSIKLIIE